MLMHTSHVRIWGAPLNCRVQRDQFFVLHELFWSTIIILLQKYCCMYSHCNIDVIWGDLRLVIWGQNSGMAGTIHVVSWHQKLLEVPARELQREVSLSLQHVRSFQKVFTKPLCWALGNESLKVLPAWPKDYRITSITLHPFLLCSILHSIAWPTEADKWRSI